MTDLLFYTLDDLAAAKREAYEQGWNDALDHVRSSNGEGSRDYL